LRRRLIIIALLAQLGGAKAESNSENPTPLLGVGHEKCREWLIYHRSADLKAKIEDQWLAGYLSGYDAFVPNDQRLTVFLEGDVKAVPSAISGYCQSHLDQEIGRAIYSFLHYTINEKQRRQN
jgi:hypothetical protein